MSSSTPNDVFNTAYVLELLQESKSGLAASDDPKSEIQNNPALKNLITQLAMLVATPTVTAEAETGVEVHSSANSGGQLTHEASFSTGTDAKRTPSQSSPGTPTSRTPVPLAKHVDAATAAGRSHHQHVDLPKKEQESMITAECCVCGMDGVRGAFFRRGFKCERCIGLGTVLESSSFATFRQQNEDHPYASPTHRRANAAPPRRRIAVANDGPQLQNSFCGSCSYRSGDADGEDQHVSSLVVTYVPYSEEEVESGRLARQWMLNELRHLAHPSFLFLFACGDDLRRHRCFFVHEQARTIVSLFAKLPAQDQEDSASPLARAGMTPREHGNLVAVESFVSAADTDALDSAAASIGGMSAHRVQSSYSLTTPAKDAGGEGGSGAMSPSTQQGQQYLVHHNSVASTISTLTILIQHLEWMRKVAYSMLQALEVLHAVHVCHGNCTPSHICIDEIGNARLKCGMIPVLEWRRTISPAEWMFLPPECSDVADDEHERPPSLVSSVDMYMLGASLCSLLQWHTEDCGFGTEPPSANTNEHSNSRQLPNPKDALQNFRFRFLGEASLLANDDSIPTFISFLEDLMHDQPPLRPSAEKALQHRVFTSVRVVNGVPAEKMSVTILIDHQASSDSITEEDSAAASAPLERGKTVSWIASEGSRGSPQTLDSNSPGPSPQLKSFSATPLIYVPRAAATQAPPPPPPPSTSTITQPLHPLTLTELTAPPSHDYAPYSTQAQRERGSAELVEFLSTQGPKFQVVRSSRISLTLYSYRTDPRRRRGKSLITSTSSVMGSQQSFAGFGSPN